MRRWLPLVALGLLAFPPAAAANTTDRCAAKDSKTVRSNKAVRVYRRGYGIYGCVRKSGVTRTLREDRRPNPNEFDSVELVRIAGRGVAFVRTRSCTVCSPGGPFSVIHQFDLRTGARRVLADVRDRPEGSEVGMRVDALALDRCGRVAYRAVLDDLYLRVYKDPELHVWEAAGRRLLDRGVIDRRSIAIGGGMVGWTRDGQAHSAPLDPAC